MAEEKEASKNDCDFKEWFCSLKKTLPTLLLTIAMATPGILLIEHWGWLNEYNSAGADFACHIRKPVNTDEIVIVEILQNEYANYFTTADRFKNLSLLIGRISKEKPALIAIDINSSSIEFRNFIFQKSWAPIVWVRDISLLEPEEESKDNLATKFFDALSPFQEKINPVQLEPVLGGSRQNAQFGVGILEPDFDGVIRRYSRRVKVIDGKVRSEDSFAWSCAKQLLSYQNKTPAEESDNESMRIIPFSRKTQFKKPSAKTLMENQNVDLGLHKKLVVIGGACAAARDIHRTPIGSKYGVEICATTIAGELTGESSEILHPLLSAVLQACIAMILLGVNSIRSLWCRILCMLCVALPTMLFVFGSLSTCATVVLLAALVQRLREWAAEKLIPLQRKKEKEEEKTKDEHD